MKFNPFAKLKSLIAKKQRAEYEGSLQRKIIYTTLKVFCYVAAAIAVSALVYIVVFIFTSGIGYINWNFLFGEYKDNYNNPSIFPALVGTLYLIVIALGIAAPLGIFTAIFLVEYKLNSGFLRWLRIAIETLASIPSIVYGLFGYMFFVIMLGWGYSILAGGMTLSIMILPVIIRTTEEALLAVPKTYREASYSFGATRVRTIFRVVLPSATGSILSGIILAIGRVVAESAALLLTLGCVPNLMPSMSNRGISLAVAVYYFSNIGNPEAAAAAATVLIVLVVCLNLLAMLVGKVLTKGRERVNE